MTIIATGIEKKVIVEDPHSDRFDDDDENYAKNESNSRNDKRINKGAKNEFNEQDENEGRYTYDNKDYNSKKSQEISLPPIYEDIVKVSEFLTGKGRNKRDY